MFEIKVGIVKKSTIAFLLVAFALALSLPLPVLSAAIAQNRTAPGARGSAQTGTGQTAVHKPAETLYTTQLTAAWNGTEIQITPQFASLRVNDTFTMTVSLLNFPGLLSYQVVFWYNGSILNMTGIIWPAGNVFGQNKDTLAAPYDIEARGDIVNHFNFTVVWSLAADLKPVDVSNGTLFQVNFTVIGVGLANIQIATLNHPATSAGATWPTDLIDSNGQDHYDFTTSIVRWETTIPEYSPGILLSILGSAMLSAVFLKTRKTKRPTFTTSTHLSTPPSQNNSGAYHTAAKRTSRTRRMNIYSVQIRPTIHPLKIATKDVATLQANPLNNQLRPKLLKILHLSHNHQTPDT